MVLNCRLRSDLSDKIIGHGLSFKKLLITWNRMVASLGRGLNSVLKRDPTGTVHRTCPNSNSAAPEMHILLKTLPVPKPCSGTSEVC